VVVTAVVSVAEKAQDCFKIGESLLIHLWPDDEDRTRDAVLPGSETSRVPSASPSDA